MNIFELNKKEIENARKTYVIYAICILFGAFILDCVFFVVHNRNNLGIFLLLSIFVSLIAIIFGFYFIFVKLKAIKHYSFILRKSDNSKTSGTYSYISKEDDFLVKDHLSYCKYIFKDQDDNIVEFLFLYNFKIVLNIGYKYLITHVDNIALNIEEVNHE